MDLLTDLRLLQEVADLNELTNFSIKDTETAPLSNCSIQGWVSPANARRWVETFVGDLLLANH
jgi:hypothetical protein